VTSSTDSKVPVAKFALLVTNYEASNIQKLLTSLLEVGAKGLPYVY